jgi:hypothetical protein
MTKPTIVTRAGKGAPLSTTEGDSNFTNLRDATFSVLANGVTVSNELNSSFEIEAGSGITVSGNNTTKKIVIANSQSAGIATVSADSAPALGGNLNVAGNSIVSLSNGDITIAPNGTGKIVLDGQNWPTADGTANQYLKTNGSGQLSYATLPAIISSLLEDIAPILGANLDVSTYKIVTNSNNRNIELDPHGTGVVAITGPLTVSGNLTVSGTTTTVNSTTVDVADLSITVAKGATNKAAANGAGLTIDLGSDGTASMQYVSATDRVLFDKQIAGSFFSNAASNFSGGTVNLGSNSNVTITGGSSGQVLRTDGSGALTWVAQSSGPASTTDLTEGTNLYFTDARARSAISISDASNTITYNSSTGVIGYTNPIPSQTGFSGRYLGTDGANLTWTAFPSSSWVGNATSDLNMVTYKIKTTSNQNLVFETASSTYGMEFKSNTTKFGYLDSVVTLTTNGTGQLNLSTNSGSDSGTIVINPGINANIGINPNGTGKIMLNGLVGINATSGTPTTYNTSYFEGTLDTPASWLKLAVGGSNYYLPMFQ